MSKPVKICAIVAMDEGRVIGVKNSMPWHFPEDMKRFSALTSGHTVLMGRKTYDSLPDRFKPLPKRMNVVVTRSPEQVSVAEQVDLVSDPVAYVESVKSNDLSLDSDTLWVIGGQQIYELLLPLCDELFVTRVEGRYEGDAFFPEFEDDFALVERDPRDGMAFERYERNSS